ncbi:hypothetical protein SMC26_31765 [Actinomadura fulvescens]|uniref:Uncharacterized protein n=1 Tax=Actinomadura fulvescens TaxID=46160 RepID=A0ABP6CJF3_9ACTN
MNGWSILLAYFPAPIALALAGPLVELDGPASAAIAIGTNTLLASGIVLLSQAWHSTLRTSLDTTVTSP